jgi:hypothetical protein
MSHSRLQFVRRSILSFGLLVAAFAANAAPLTLEWVTTGIGPFTDTRPRVVSAVQSFSATLELRDDRLLTEGVFFDRPVTLVGAELRGEVPPPPAIERRAQQFTTSIGPRSSIGNLGIPQTYDLFSHATVTFAGSSAWCAEASAPCYIVDLREIPSPGDRRFIGALWLVSGGDRTFLFDRGFLRTGTSEIWTQSFTGYWQVATNKVPVPSTFALLLVGALFSAWRSTTHLRGLN